MKKTIAAVLVAALLGSAGAEATVLTFDSSVGFSESYGDRVGAAVEGDFSYGSAHGFTPNVTIEYIEDAQSLYSIVPSGYSTLTNVLKMNSAVNSSEGFAIRLRADAGYLVAFHGFDVATTDPIYNTGEIAVADAFGRVVLGGEDIDVGAGVLSMGNAFPVVSREITIRVGYYTPNDGTYPVAVDNIAFGQISRRAHQRARAKNGSAVESSWSEVKGLFR